MASLIMALFSGPVPKMTKASGMNNLCALFKAPLAQIAVKNDERLGLLGSSFDRLPPSALPATPLAYGSLGANVAALPPASLVVAEGDEGASKSPRLRSRRSATSRPRNALAMKVLPCPPDPPDPEDRASQIYPLF